MKVIAFNGSPHKMGNTASALELAKEQFESAGIEFEIFHVGIKPVAGCMGCGMCFKNKNDGSLFTGRNFENNRVYHHRSVFNAD